MSRLIEVLPSKINPQNIAYFMTKSFRIYNNYSLFEAYKKAKKEGLNLSVYIVEPYELNCKNKKFFEEKTMDLEEKLLTFSSEVYRINRDKEIEILIKDIDSIYMDKVYLKHDLDFYESIKQLAYRKHIGLFTVESNVFVPVRVASDKEEYSARTIRNKINTKLNDYRDEVLTDFDLTIAETEAFNVLNDFIINKLDNYHLHNDPSMNYTSLLSPYLKYGFISPVVIYNKINHINTDNSNAFLEELIIRRELAYNFVYFNPTYDDFNYMTYDWAYRTMKHHLNDEREYIYTKEDYINFKTHDEYFNAAMREMVFLGRMHSYMRMYWCKKIIEWSPSYEEAYRIALELNNYYFLDGLTPNGYAGVAWCFGKHDRAWTERKIFGKLRYMNSNGLERKFNIKDYVENMKKVEERLKK
jgi:deoxyribodipyrimidine photo-lyase